MYLRRSAPHATLREHHWYAVRDARPHSDEQSLIVGATDREGGGGGGAERRAAWHAWRYVPVRHRGTGGGGGGGGWTMRVEAFAVTQGERLPDRSTFLGECRADFEMPWDLRPGRFFGEAAGREFGQGSNGRLMFVAERADVTKAEYLDWVWEHHLKLRPEDPEVPSTDSE